MTRAILTVPVGARVGEVLEIRALLQHPMETGYRLGSDGQALARDLVRRVVGVGPVDQLPLHDLHGFGAEQERVAELRQSRVIRQHPPDRACAVDETGRVEQVDGRVGRRVTSPLGPLKLKEIKGGAKALTDHIAKVVAGLHAEMDHETAMRLFLVGGSWRPLISNSTPRRPSARLAMVAVKASKAKCSMA